MGNVSKGSTPSEWPEEIRRDYWLRNDEQKLVLIQGDLDEARRNAQRSPEYAKALAAIAAVEASTVGLGGPRDGKDFA